MMNDRATISAILQPKLRVRYLKLIALFKMAKGLLLLALGASILFLNARHGWMEKISDWADTEILLGHSKPISFLLNKLQDVPAGICAPPDFSRFFIAGFSSPKGSGFICSSAGRNCS